MRPHAVAGILITQKGVASVNAQGTVLDRADSLAMGLVNSFLKQEHTTLFAAALAVYKVLYKLFKAF